MQLIFNPSGTHIHNGQLKVRFDLYPDEGEKTHARHYVDHYDRELTQEERDDEAKRALVPKHKEINPALCMFVAIDKDTTVQDIEAHLQAVLDKDTLATLDEVLLNEHPGHWVKPLMEGKLKLSGKKTLLANIASINARFAGVKPALTGNGKAKDIRPQSLDIGDGATDRASAFPYGYTIITKGNPANASGTFDTWELWFNSTYGNAAGVKVATFYLVSGTNFSTRDSESIGGVTAGSKQTFAGLSTDTETGDYAGSYFSAGFMERDTAGFSGVLHVVGDKIPCTNVLFTLVHDDDAISIYGTGITNSTVTTQAATNVNAIFCTANGEITDTGGSNATRRGFCYVEGEAGDPTTADSVVYDDGDFGTGAYSKQIMGLSPSSHYRVRAYAVNTKGTGYGSTVQVDTDAAGTPTVTTQAASAVGETTATGNGNITDAGGGCTRRGFCYKVGTSGDPTTADSTVYDDGTFAEGAYTKGITGLTAGTSYRVRAYVINSTGTAYGDTVQILTKPAAPTGVAATDGTYTDKVVVTWTKSTGATGYKVYRDDVLVDTLGDVATYDDTGADAPTITPGAAAASDGAYSTRVALSISGHSTTVGTTHTYKVKASSSAGDSPDSAADDGYRGVGALTYQWQRSAADSDADYANITGATAATYNDTSALPRNGEGRYYKCVLNASGAAQQISTSDRGFLMHYNKPRNSYTLLVKDNSGNTLAYLPEAWGIRTDHRVNEIPTLEFTVPGDCAARAYLIDPNEAWLYKDGVLEDIFRITAPEKNRSSSIDITVECQGIAYALKKSAVVSYTATDTPTNHLTALLALQETAVITLGGVDPSLDTSFALAVSKTDIWTACKEIQKTRGGYLYVTFDSAAPATRTLWLWSNLGEDKGQQIRINKNLIGVRHRTDYNDTFNKLYAFGTGVVTPDDKSFSRVDVTKSADATYGYLTLKESYAAYKDWSAVGDALPGNVTLEQAGGGWISPTSHTPSMPAWFGEEYAYDGNINTASYAYTGLPGGNIAAGTYSTYLVLNISATTTTQVRIYNGFPSIPGEVDIYYGSAWHNIQGLAYMDKGWNTYSFASQSITSIRIRLYNNTSTEQFGQINEIQVWSATGYTDITSTYKQGANENVCRVPIASYDADAPYVISYTHAPYLISIAAGDDRTKIYSTTKDFSTDNIDTLLAQARVHMAEIAAARVSLDIDMVDLSTVEGRGFEELQLGSTVKVIDEELGISEEAVVARIERPDLGNHPEQIKIEVSNKVKDIIDYLLE